MDMRESCTKLQTLQCMLLGWVISPVVTTDCEKNSLATFKRFAQEKRFSIECHSVERSWTGWFGASSVFRITPGSAFVCKSFLPHSNSRLPPSPPPAIGRLGHYPTNTTIWPDVCLSLLLRYCLFLFPSVCAVKGICFVRPTVLLNFKLWCSNALLLYHFTRSGTIQWNLLTCILTGKVKQLNSRLLKNTKSKQMRPGMSHA